MGFDAQMVRYRDGDVELTGVFVGDEGWTEVRPGVMVVHGGAGLDEHAKRQARRWAELGYMAFACDMYGDGVMGDRERVMARIGELRGNPERLCQRATTGLETLRSHPLVDGRVAAVGYCFGGMTVLEMARSGAELLGAVSVHGTLQTSQRCEPGAVKAKILVCHGALDPYVPMAHVDDFVLKMSEAGVDWQLIVYGGALHGFTHQAPSSIPGVAYDAVADRRSGKAISDFLDEVFGMAG
jgi:dienelactone hydrolase